MKKKHKFTIELFERHDNADFYSIRFEGEPNCEYEKFLLSIKAMPQYQTELGKIVYWIDVIGRKGSLERYFRPCESKVDDNVCAIPTESSDLRLYCIRLSDELIILGNGGIKKTRTYNVDPHLNSCVVTLSKLDSLIKQKLRSRTLSIKGRKITGDVSFYITN